MESIEKIFAYDEEEMIRTTVRLSKSTVSMLSNLSKKYGESLGYAVRLAVELEYERYCGSVRYIDRKQAAEILADVKKLIEICNEILNNVRCIGISYNRELHLKHTEKICHEVLKNDNASAEQKTEAVDAYNKEKAEIENTLLDRDELKNVLEQFEAAAEKARCCYGVFTGKPHALRHCCFGISYSEPRS